MNELTIHETDRLTLLEDVVSKNLQSFYEFGAALKEIRDSKLYRQRHKTFEVYCEDRWEITSRHAYRLIEAKSVVDNLSENVTPGSHTPKYEKHARPLTRLSKPLQIEAWDMVVETAPDGKITARYVNEVVNKIEGKEVERQTRTVREKINKLDLMSNEFKTAFDAFYGEVQLARVEHWENTSKEAAALCVEMVSALVTALQ